MGATTENACIWASVDLAHLQGGIYSGPVHVSNIIMAGHKGGGGPADTRVQGSEGLCNVRLNSVTNG